MHHARFLQHCIPNARLHIIQGAGHAAWLEKADEFNRVVLDFLLDDPAAWEEQTL